MSSATRPRPRFRPGDWVSYQFGKARILVQVIEDRGPLGAGGERIYGVRIERDDDEPTTTEVPESELRKEDEILGSHTAASDLGYAVQNWPVQVFEVRYRRAGGAGDWTAVTERGEILEGTKARGAVAITTARWASDSADDENWALVTVFIEFDPRLRDPRIGYQPGLWEAMTEEARHLADARFKRRYPKAMITHRR